MSGIVAYFDRGGSVDRRTIRAMCERIDHRGPDGDGQWVDEQVGIGHQSHKTTPEAVFEQQPTRVGDVVVAFDGRLDNRPELFELLSDPPSPSEQTADSQLLLAAYREWGTSCLTHLVGAFAFVIWDGKRERVFCARDHFGVKPLYYHHDDGIFAVASEQKALLEVPSVDRMLDQVKVGDFLTGTFEDKSNTFFSSIRRLEPSHAISVSSERADHWQYWTLDPTRTITLSSDGAYERRFRELFEQAVSCRLRSSGTVGADLSGGMDSSSITVMARKLLPSAQPLHTFSNVFDDARASDEREFIETIGHRPGITSHYVFLDNVSALTDREMLMEYFDEPPHNTMNFAQWEDMKRAQDIGVDVVLSGALGDSAISYGLGLLPELFRTGQWRLLNRELRAMGAINGASRRALFLNHTLKPLVPQAATWRFNQLRGEPVLEQDANAALNPQFVEQIGLRDRYRELNDLGSVLRRSGRRWQHRSLLSGETPATFETVNQMGALFDVESRYPFTDKRLVEFSLAMPATQQLKDGWTRSIMRRSIPDLLPGKIQWRPWKTSVSSAFWNALRTEETQLRTLVDDPGPVSPYLDEDQLQSVAHRFDSAPTSRDARTLWRGLSLRSWLAEAGSAPR